MRSVFLILRIASGGGIIGFCKKVQIDIAIVIRAILVRKIEQVRGR